MESRSSDGSAPPAPAQIAKAALRRMAQQRLEPTPLNYATAWRDEGGQPPALAELPAADRAGLNALAARALPQADAPARERLGLALAGGRFDELNRLLDDAQAARSQGWAELIERVVRGVGHGTRQWTTARKKDSLQRVLSANRADANRLHQRLSQLLNNWDGDGVPPEAGEGDAGPQAESAAIAAADAATPQGSPGDRAAAERSDVEPIEAGTSPVEAGTADAGAAWRQVVSALQGTVQAALPDDDARASEVARGLRGLHDELLAAGPGAEITARVAEACAEAQRVLQHRHHLLAQLGTLCHELTDGLSDLAEDDSWVHGQCEAMRGQLDAGLTARGVRSVSDLLRNTRLRQQQLRVERTQARDALKQLIHRMLQDIGELGEHTGRFQENVGRYAEAIGRADSLESLAGTVREMVEETRAVQSLVSQTQQRLHDEHAKATELSERVARLEAEIRRLSDEVGTDPLTQIANRRGLMSLFEAERSRADRSAAALAVGLLDIDNFKKLNDSLGHQAGDEALKFLARRVKELLRPTDALARYGGEEFVVLLPETPTDEAQRVLTRVQRELSAEFFMHENRQTFITFSAGVTCYREGEAIEAALQRADEALYEAKRTGKNRTCVA